MLQKKVGLYPSIGFPGQQVAFNQAVYTAENFMSDGTCKAGSFAFRKAPQDAGTAVKFGIASLTGQTGDKVLGLVERNIIGSGNLNIPDDEANTFENGAEITIATRGDYYIIAPSAATIGQAVLCDPTTGAITLGTAGATNDTGWTVFSEGAEGEPIIIVNHGVSVSTASA